MLLKKASQRICKFLEKWQDVNDRLEKGDDRMAYNAMKRLFSLPEMSFSKGRILEVGAGTGRFTREILKYVDDNTELVALEMNKKPYKYLLKTLKKMRPKGGNVKPMLVDFYNNGFSSEGFDLVIVAWFDMTMTLFEWNKLMIESNRLLKKNGIIAFDFMDSQEDLLNVVNEPSNHWYNLINGADLEKIAICCGFNKIGEFTEKFNRQIAKYHIYRKNDNL